MYWAILSYCGPQLDVFVIFLKGIQGIYLTYSAFVAYSGQQQKIFCSNYCNYAETALKY